MTPGPAEAAFDVVEVVGRVDEDAAHRRADQLRVDRGRVGRRQLGRPLGRDRAAGVTDQPDLLRRGEPGRRGGERRLQAVEGVDPVLGAGGEVGVLALGVGDDDGPPGEQLGPDQRRLDLGDRAAQGEPAGDRVGGLVDRVQRVVEGLVGDDLRGADAERRLQHRGDVHGRFAELRGRAIEQLHRRHRQRDADHVVAQGPRLEHGPRRDLRQRRGPGVAVEGIFFRLRRRRSRGLHEQRQSRDRRQHRGRHPSQRTLAHRLASRVVRRLPQPPPKRSLPKNRSLSNQFCEVAYRKLVGSISDTWLKESWRRAEIPERWPRSRNRFVLFLLGAVAALALLVPAVASAAGEPNISLEKIAPEQALIGTQQSVTLLAKNPAGQPRGYNLTFRDVLPEGVTYVPGSASVSPRILEDAPAEGETTLLFENVADLSADSEYALSYKVEPSTTIFKITGEPHLRKPRRRLRQPQTAEKTDGERERRNRLRLQGQRRGQRENRTDRGRNRKGRAEPGGGDPPRRPRTPDRLHADGPQQPRRPDQQPRSRRLAAGRARVPRLRHRRQHDEHEDEPRLGGRVRGVRPDRSRQRAENRRLRESPALLREDRRSGTAGATERRLHPRQMERPGRTRTGSGTEDPVRRRGTDPAQLGRMAGRPNRAPQASNRSPT